MNEEEARVPTDYLSSELGEDLQRYVRAAVQEAVDANVFERVEVVPVQDVLDRMQPEETASLMEGELVPVDSEPLVLIQQLIEGLTNYFQEDDNKLLTDIRDNTDSILEEIKKESPARPFLTTNFSDYSVTEGLLLMVFLLCIIHICIKMLKGGFSWLNW